MPRPLDDDRLAQAMALVLRISLLLSAAFVLLGGFLYLNRHGGQFPHYDVFQGEPPEYRTVTGIARSTSNFRGRGLIQVGVLLLLATPVARVVAALIGFALQRDRLYIAVSLIVLTVLLVSILGGYL